MADEKFLGMKDMKNCVSSAKVDVWYSERINERELRVV